MYIFNRISLSNDSTWDIAVRNSEKSCLWDHGAMKNNITWSLKALRQIYLSYLQIRWSNLEFNVLFIPMLKCLTFADLILNVNPFANNGWKVLLFLRDGKQNRCYLLNQTTRSTLSLVIFNCLAYASPVGSLVFRVLIKNISQYLQ